MPERAQPDRWSGDLLGLLHGARAISQARLGGQVGDHPRRRLAWMNLQLAKARWGEGTQAAGAALAERQVATLQTLAQAPKAGDAMLNLGEACLFMAQAQPAARPGWLARSRAAYEQAAMLRPLNGDHLINYRAAGGKA